MARHYRVGPAIWLEPWDDDVRLVAFYILTCPHRKTEGLFRLPLSYAAEDMGWRPAKFRHTFDKLIRHGFIEYDDQAQVVLIVKALKWQPTTNPKHALAAVRALADVPETPLLARLCKLAAEHDKWLSAALQEHYPEAFLKAFPEPSRIASLEPSGGGYGEPPSPSPSPSPSLPPKPPEGGRSGEERKVVTFERKTVPPARLELAERVFADFNQQAGTGLGAYTATGKPSDGLTRIISALTAWPAQLDFDTCRRCTTAVLKGPKWWDGPPHPGVVFGPGVIEKHIALVAGVGREKSATEKAMAADARQRALTA